MSRHEAEQLEMPLGESPIFSKTTIEKRVSIEILLSAVGGEQAVRMFEKTQSDKSPIEIEEIRFFAEQIQNMNHLIRKTGEAKKELLQMLEIKLSPSW
jgi:hypothetical protein